MRFSTIRSVVLGLAFSLNGFSERALCAEPNPPAFIEAYLSDLGGDDVFVAVRAAEALGKLGATAESAAPALAEKLSADDPHLRAAVAHALGEIAPPPDVVKRHLSEALHDEDESVRVASAEALWSVEGDVEPVLPVLEAILSNPQSRRRLEAVSAIGRLGNDAHGAAPKLRALVRQKELGPLRVAAAMSLWKVIGDPEEALAVLTEVLEAEDQLLAREAAAVALGQVGPPAQAAVPAIVDLIKDASAPPQPTPDEPAPEASRGQTGDEDDAKRSPLEQSDVTPAQFRVIAQSAQAVRKIEGDEAAATTFLRLAELDKPVVQMVLARLLAQMDSVIIEQLLTAASADDPARRRLALAALGQITLGDEVPAAVVDSLQREDAQLRSVVIGLLIRSQDPQQATYLERALDDDNDHLRLTAAAAILESKPSSDHALSTVLAVLKDESSSARARAAYLAAHLGAADRQVVAALIEALGDERFYVRRAAVGALVRLGPAAKSALPLLRQLAAQDEAGVVREEAQSAIESLEASDE